MKVFNKTLLRFSFKRNFTDGKFYHFYLYVYLGKEKLDAWFGIGIVPWVSFIIFNHKQIFVREYKAKRIF